MTTSPGRLRRLLSLSALVLLVGCSGGDDGSSSRTTPSASGTASVVPLPTLAGPRSERPFDVIRRYGIKPGSPDDLLIQDLFVVADAQRSHIAVTGRVGSLEDLQRARRYRLRGGKMALVSGLGGPFRFCLRAYQSDESPRQWFYDTDHVLPPGESC